MNLKGKVLAIVMLLVSFASCINAGNLNATQKSRDYYNSILTDLNLKWYKAAYGYTFTDNGTVYNVILITGKNYTNTYPILDIFVIPNGYKQKILDAGVDMKTNRYIYYGAPRIKENGLTKNSYSGKTKYKARIYTNFSFGDGKTFNYDKTINIPDNIVKNIFDLVDGKTQYKWAVAVDDHYQWLKNHEPFDGSSSTTTTTTTTVAKSVKITSVKLEHNVYQNGKKGMNILVSFKINGYKNVKGHVNAYFYHNDGTALRDENGDYCTKSGYVSTWEDINPGYDKTTYTDFKLFIPIDELHLHNLPKGDHKLKLTISVWANHKELCDSDWYYFTYEKA